MPHVIVKMYPGRSEQAKTRLALAITEQVVVATGCTENAVSVAIEEVEPAAWPQSVYQPDILEKTQFIYKKPGYNPFK